jgi:hypothetical protein
VYEILRVGPIYGPQEGGENSIIFILFLNKVLLFQLSHSAYVSHSAPTTPPPAAEKGVAGHFALLFISRQAKEIFMKCSESS